MKINLNVQTVVGLQLLVVCVAVVVGLLVAQVQQKMIIQALEEQLNASHTTLRTLSKLTDQNSADEEVSAIVPDCSRRTEYESLLMTLHTLHKKDLVVVQNLHENCGTYYTMQKSLMVSKFDHEVQTYVHTVALLEKLGAHEAYATKVQQWNELLGLEKTRSSLLIEQTAVQKEVISALISGSSVQSQVVTDLLREASEINELLDVQNQKIDVVRESVST